MKMRANQETIEFRPGVGPTPNIEARSVDDLIEHRIHVCPDFVAKQWGKEAAEKYRAAESEAVRRSRF